MQVKEIMTPNPKTVSPDMLVKDVATMMLIERISGAPVVDEDNNIVGIISEKDILIHMFPTLDELMNESRPDFEALENNYQNTMTLTVKDLMSGNVSTVSSDIPCLKAASMMWIRKIRRIPVADNGKLVGIISIGDVHRAIFKNSIT